MEVSKVFKAFDEKYSNFLSLRPKIEINEDKIEELKEELKELELKTGKKDTFMFLKMTDEIDVIKKNIKTLEGDIERFEDRIEKFPDDVNLMITGMRKKHLEIEKENLKKLRTYYCRIFKISIASISVISIVFLKKKLKH